MINIKLEYYFYYESKRSKTFIHEKKKLQRLKQQKNRVYAKQIFFPAARWNFVELTEHILTEDE